MFEALFAVLTSVAIASAPSQATVTGAWSGSLTFRILADEKAAPIHAVLKQTGDVLTGTAGPDADRQYRILKGKATTTKAGVTITFELIVDGEHTAFELTLADGLLKGKATSEGEDGRPHAGSVELRPVKNPAVGE
jgi:hypothetical protein